MVPRRRQQGGAGRKRIDTSRLIQDPAARQVAFSKRRQTLINMASDVSALCGVRTAVVVFSSSARGTPYALGSPSVDAVLRLLPASSSDYDAALPVAEEEEEKEHDTRVAALRQQLDDTRAQLEAEQAQTKAVVAAVNLAREAAGQTHWWWEADVNALGAAELPDFQAALSHVRDAAQRHAESSQNGAPTTTTGRLDAPLHAADQNGA